MTGFKSKREAAQAGSVSKDKALKLALNRVELQQFADLIRADEREACAKVCEEQWEIDGTRTAQEFATAIRARGNT